MNIIRPTTITDAMFISSNLLETDDTAYNAATTYATGNTCMVVATHRLYESLKDANTGNYPPDNLTGTDPWWEETGATNKWRVFDQVVGNQATHATVLEYELEPGAINSISLQNVEAVEATYVMTDPTDGEVYNETIPLISTINVNDWFDYFFEEILKIDTVVTWDLPNYPAATLDISINNGASVVNCGEIVVGTKLNIGRTLYPPQASIKDYSTKTLGASGAYAITEGYYSKKLSVDVRMEEKYMDNTFRMMAQYRATPLVWEAVAGYSSMIAYGFYSGFKVVLPGTTYSECSIEIEGLT